MKKFLLCLMGVLAMMNGAAQHVGLANKDGFRLNWMEPQVSKSDRQFRMSGFTTSDNYEFCTYGYDGAGRLVAVFDSVPGDFCLIDSMFYDEQGQMTRLAGWQLLDGRWQNVYYIDYTYDEAGNIATRTNYNNFGGNWELGGVYNYTYNSDNQIVLTVLTMGGVQFQKVEYTYTNGLLMQELWYAYSFETSALMPSEKVDYVYVGGLVATKHDSISEDGRTFSYLSRYEYDYDDYGNCVEYEYYDQTGQIAERSLYTFDYSLSMSEVQFPWNPEIVRPRTFDNVNVYDREAWYTVDVEHVLHYVCDYVYSYESATNGIADCPAMSLTVEPNPAADFVTIGGLGEGPARVRVFDALGRLMMESVLSDGGNRMDVSRLNAGCYVVTVQQQKSIRSFKLLVE